jgi:hypothetical protein
MEIINACKKAPLGAVWHLKRALRWIDRPDLEGLYGVVLYEDMPEVTEDTPDSIKQHLEAGFLCPGQYVPRRGEYTPHIALYLSVIYHPIPAIYFLSPVPTLRLAADLAHGVAYHVLALTESKYRGDEEFVEDEGDERFVDEYVSKILRRMQTRWHYRFGQWLKRKLADRCYNFGVQDWQAGHYGQAAEHWQKARMLNPHHENATRWYWRAKELMDSQNQGSV